MRIPNALSLVAWLTLAVCASSGAAWAAQATSAPAKAGTSKSTATKSTPSKSTKSGGTAAKQSAAKADTASTKTTSGKRPGGLTFEDRTLSLLDGQTREVELGKLYVPESRDRDSTHLIHLAFLRYKSTSPKPGPPIVFLAGGPGLPGSLMARAPAYDRLFDKLRALGDVIVPDPRGTGLSEPNLACAPVTPSPDFFESEEAMRRALLAQLTPCAAKLRQEGVAIEAFETWESAADLEDIRRALGAERLRLVAESYGTELALATIRRFGPKVERAALAGVRGPSQALKLPGVLDLQLRRISGLVAKDPDYATAPTVELLARALIDKLDKTPISLTSSASGGGQQTLKVRGAGLAAVLQGDLTDTRAVLAVPAMLNAMADGDFRFFLGRLQVLYNTMVSGTSALSIASNCASGANLDRRAEVDREAADSPFGNIRNLYQDPSFCKAVGATDLGSKYRVRLYSPVPALFLSGSLDATTPSFEAEEVAWGFPNGVHLVVENAFHDLLSRDEVQAVVVDFLGGADVKGRRVAAPPPHFLSLDEARKLFEQQTTPKPR